MENLNFGFKADYLSHKSRETMSVVTQDILIKKIDARAEQVQSVPNLSN